MCFGQITRTEDGRNTILAEYIWTKLNRNNIRLTTSYLTFDVSHVFGLLSQSTDTVKMRRAVAERETSMKRAATENKKLERLVKELEGNLADADEKEAR